MDNIKWQSKKTEVTTGAHPDHATNIKTAEVFVRNFEKSMKSGMSVMVSGDTALTIAFKPPLNAPMGATGVPIALSQSCESFRYNLEAAANAVMRVATQFWEKNGPEVSNRN